MPQKLSDLPKRDAKYWTEVDADVQIHGLQHRPCEHIFASIAGNEVECRKCHIGFFMTNETNLKDGHIYKGNKRLI